MKCLAEFRASQGLTCKQMAERLGISLVLYNAVEYDQRLPSRNFMERFKKAFPSYDINIFFDELLFRLNRKEKENREEATA